MDKRTKITILLFVIFTCGLLTAGCLEGLRQSSQVEPIASSILRFHVLANSDTPEDQALKLQVRTALLEYMEETLASSASEEEIESYVNEHKEELTQVAENTIQKSGYEYPVALSLENTYFPAKTYGDMTFPRGTYRALRVQIGEAKGQNWWCVLYPPLCFTDAVHAEVPETSKSTLKNVLEEEDYNLLEQDVEVRFWLLDALGEIFH